MFLSARALDFAPPGRLDEDVCGRLRAAQVATLVRRTPALALVNMINALLLVAALLQRPSCPEAYAWLVAIALYFAPLMLRLRRRRHRSPPVEVGSTAIRRATIYAAVLGSIWGVAPALFFDAGQSDHLIVACIAIGMMSGGALALATLPQALVAYSLPLALGCAIGLLRGAREPIHYLIAPLLITYFSALVLAALSQGRQFAIRVIAQVRAENAARHDPLTGLPNRTAFTAALEDAYRRLDRYGEKFALLYIDLDDFKDVNDRLGHQAGDQLLQQMAGRLAGQLRDKDELCRLGGDEFVLLARGVADAQTAADIAGALIQTFEPPFKLDGGAAYARASIGLALAPADGADAAALLTHADAALYIAKRDRTAAPQFFRNAQDSEARDRRALAQDIKGALARRELFMQFQPIVNLATGRIESNEALVRWRHPTRGLVPPSIFIPVAEQTGAIHDIGEWIMFEACREAALWPDDVNVAVNVSAEQICDHSIVSIVESALRAGGLSPSRLHVEVTESAALGAAHGTAAAIERLHELGAAIVLDDFGTGFSSFDHIRRLPVSSIKIDRSFVADLHARKSRAVVHAVAHLAHALDLGVTAEGIETQTQLEFLKSAGCRSGQGYLLSRPQDGAVVREQMRASLAA